MAALARWLTVVCCLGARCSIYRDCQQSCVVSVLMLSVKMQQNVLFGTRKM